MRFRFPRRSGANIPDVPCVNPGNEPRSARALAEGKQAGEEERERAREGGRIGKGYVALFSDCGGGGVDEVSPLCLSIWLREEQFCLGACFAPQAGFTLTSKQPTKTLKNNKESKN